MIASVLSALALAAAVQTPAVAQVEQDPAAVALPDIIVRTRGLQDRARQFVDQVVAPPAGSRAARWDRPVCVSVSNMDAGYAQALIDDIAMMAVRLGLEPGAPGCEPNVVIVASSDGAASAKLYVRENPRGFRPSLSQTDRGERALEQFQNSDAPVRWWHLSSAVMTDTGERATLLRGEQARSRIVRDPSRLRTTTRDVLNWVVIVVDLNRAAAAGATFGGLSDYVTMAALAQINPDADLAGQETVLNLFAEPGQVDGFSDWDRDYLAALYDSQAEQADVLSQQVDLASRLLAAAQRRDALADPTD